MALYVCLRKCPSRKELLYRRTFTLWPETTEQLLPMSASVASRTMIDLLGFTLYAHHLPSDIIARERAAMMTAMSDDANRRAVLSFMLSSWKMLTDDFNTRPVRPSNARDVLLAPREDLSYLLLTICMPAAEEPGLDVTYLRGYHRALSDALNAFVCRGAPPHLKAPTLAFPRKVERSTLAVDPYLDLHRTLADPRNRPGCCYAECARAAHPGKLRNARRADWHGEGEAAPHLTIRDMLHELMMVASLDTPPADFADACRRNEFPRTRVKRLMDWARGGPQSYGAAAPPVRTGEGGFFNLPSTSPLGTACENIERYPPPLIPDDRR